MGKIKVRTIGGELEQEEKRQQKAKSAKKKLKEEQDASQVSAEEVKTEGKPLEQEKKLSEAKSASGGEPKKEKKAKFQKTKHKRSKKYLAKASMVDKSKGYPLNEAIELLEKMQTFSAKGGPASGRDETVELHLNSKDPKIQASTTLPHGTGKTIRVAIASDEVIAEVEKGKVNFDILLANPSMMPKLAKIAKVLGPRGLMPNPKNGTITNNPQEEAKKYEGGLTSIKTESKAPIIHVAVGKMSFGPKKLEENISAVVSAVKKENIEKAVLKSTMSPAIKLSL